MAFPKKEIFPPEDQRLSAFGRAMAHPARIFIMPHLLTNGELCVREIEKLLCLSQPAVSDHLCILRETQFIDVDCRGRYNFYTLNKEQLHQANVQMQKYFQDLFHNDQFLLIDCEKNHKY